MPASPLYVPEPHGLNVLRTYGDGFAGRDAELAALDQAWNDGTVRVFVLHAEGGAGKTRIVARWLTLLRDDGWRGAGRVFVHSFYSQGSDEKRNASSELFFEQALLHFGHTGPPLIDPTEQGRTLARLIVEQRGLLVLDGLEPLQHPPSFDQGRLKDLAIHSLLRSLAAGRINDPTGRNQCGLCVVTSRQPVQELKDKIGQAIVQQSLDRLDAAAGIELLRQLEVHGPEKELREAVEDSRGHAYSLMLLGTYLRDATDDHEIRRRREIPLLAEDAEHRYHARHLFGAYVEHLGETSPEVAVLRLLGFFDRPAEEGLIAVLREAPEPGLDALNAPLRSLSPADWHRVLRRLTDLRLIDVPVSASPPIDSHPLLREYFAEHLQTHFPETWQAGHRRLFAHLCETTEYRPATLTDLQPLYQAIAHGCLAGLHENARAVYIDRIQRGTGADGFYTKSLGAVGADLGAVACFFAATWTTLTPGLTGEHQAWLFNEAAMKLLYLGRLTEAVGPFKIGLERRIEQGRWQGAARQASNLSQLRLTLGEISTAIDASLASITYADRSESVFEQMACRVSLATCLHQTSQRDESLCLFEDAESRQAARQGNYPRLYSLQGFLYCELLLSDAERAAWQRFLHISLTPASAACDTVSERALQWFDWRSQTEALIDAGLEHLTLARALLYKDLSGDTAPGSAFAHATAAVDRLRTASALHHLPNGLLTRAWLRYLSGDQQGSHEDLDGAWEIAFRGPMPLFQADIQLYRARLFRDLTALAEARRLIEKHGYHRRDEELADAESSANGWPETATSKLPQPAEPNTNEGSMRDQIFISYSHRDKKLMRELLTHLEPYLRSGSVEGWCDRDIVSGSKWFDELQAALSKTSVAVLLVSPDFLASNFIHDHELTPLLKKAELGGVKILWVQIRASAYEETSLKNYQAVVSPPDKPLGAKSKADRDEAWVQVCKAIKNAVNP